MAVKELPTLLIIHGGGHSDPTYWSRFIPELEKAGIVTESGSAPSDGGYPAPGRSMYDDAIYWRKKIEQLVDAGKEVILFTHSIGSVVGTEASIGLTKAAREKKGLSGGVSHMIFLAGYLAAQGEAVASFYGKTSPLPQRSVYLVGGSGGIIADLKPYAGYFYSDLSQDEVEKWGELLKHVPAEWWSQSVTHTTWKEVPVTWILTEKDEIVLPQYQEKMLQDGKKKHGVDIKTYTIPSGHSPFLNMPDKLTDIVKTVYGI